MEILFEDEHDGEVFLEVCKLLAFIMEENERLKSNLA
jgi:hypothetical protein